MRGLTLTEWAAVAQVIALVVTTAGLMASMYFSLRALREVQLDRRQRQMPHIAFQARGIRMPIRFVQAGPHIPGVNPGYVQKAFPDLPANAESVRMADRHNDDGSVEPIFLGRLRNYGLGPALETRVTWIAENITIGQETFVIDSTKLQEPRYSRELNTMPTWESHIPPGGESQLTRLPTFIEKDIDHKIVQATGVLLLSCRDVFGTEHQAWQEFYLATGYAETPPYVHVTFRGMRRS